MSWCLACKLESVLHSPAQVTGKHFVLLKSLLFRHGSMPEQDRCSKTFWGMRKAKKWHLCQCDSKIWSAQDVGPGSTWNTWWQGPARGIHMGSAPLDDDINLPQHFWPREALFLWRILNQFYTTGSERLSSPQPLLLLSHFSHKHLTGHFFRSETNFFPFYEASSVIPLRRCSTEWITDTNKKMAYFCI